MPPPSRNIPDEVRRQSIRQFADASWANGDPRFFFQDAAQRNGQGVEAARLHHIGFGFMNNVRANFGPGDRIIADADYRGITDRPRWNYILNQAFWAGGMLAGRTFELAQPFDPSHVEVWTQDNTITGDELLMLWDANYRFEFDPENPTRLLARPTDATRQMLANNTLMIADYNPNRMMRVYNQYYDGPPQTQAEQDQVLQIRQQRVGELGEFLVQLQQRAQQQYEQKQRRERSGKPEKKYEDRYDPRGGRGGGGQKFVK